MPKIHVEATLTLNEKEVKVLAHMLSYGPAKRVHVLTGGSNYSVEDYELVFASMQQALGQIINAAEEAAKKVF